MAEQPSADPRILVPAKRPGVGATNADRAELEALVSTVRLSDLLVTLRRHVWLISGVTVAVVATIGITAYMATPVYRGVAVIRLSDPRRVLTSGFVDGPIGNASGESVDPLLSQVELLTSRSVAGEVVDSMPILRVRARSFPAAFLGEVAVAATAAADSFGLAFAQDSFVAAHPSGDRAAAYGTTLDFGRIRFAVQHRPEARRGLLQVLSREAAISRLIRNLGITRRARTDIVDVAYAAPDPYRAQQVVNRVVDVFRTTSAEAAQRQSRLRREFLEVQLKVNDSVLAVARHGLTAFRQRARADGSGESVTREQTGLPVLALERDQLDAERSTYRSVLASLSEASAGRKALQIAFSIPGVAANPMVAQLSAQLHEYEAVRDSLGSRSASHPDLPRFSLLISSTEAKLLRAAQAGVQSSITVLDGRIAALDGLRTRLAGSLQRVSATEAEEARLLERVDNARKIADELRIEYEKARISEAVTVGQVELVDRAALPVKPVGIGLPERLALGLLLGLLLGGGGAFLAEHLSRSIARQVQVDQLGVTVLGVVPRFGGNGGEKHAKNADSVIEAFRGVRMNVVNAYGTAGPVLVAITSPGTREGKSFVSSNMALAFAYAHHRTLLVDADLRRGALHRVLNLSRRPGLTDFLAGDVPPERIFQTTTYPSLDFIASGSRRRDAPELMGSPRMTDLLSRARASYEVVVLDTPPLAAGVDAFALAMLAGNLLLVLRLGQTDRQVAEAKLDVLRRLPIRLLGAVLNDVRSDSDYGAYSYYMDGYEHTNEPLFEPLVASKRSARPRVAHRTPG
jgi:capsular exopolysaccharide synthesis family protein